MEKGKITIYNRSDYTDTESINIVTDIMDKKTDRMKEYSRLSIVDGNEIKYRHVRKGDSFFISDGAEKNQIIIHNCSNLPDREVMDYISKTMTRRRDRRNKTEIGAYMVLYKRLKTADVYHLVGGQ